MLKNISLLKKIMASCKDHPRLAILMSGQGSNAASILKERHRYPNLEFVTICTDKKASRAEELSQLYKLNYYCQEVNAKNDSLRQAYFNDLAIYLESLNIDLLIYAGFMKITPRFFVEKFPGLNIHPADLTILGEDGHPKFKGANGVEAAIRQGEKHIASTVHVVDHEVDCGLPLMVSKRLVVNEHTNIAALHQQLKSECEHLLFPTVLEMLSQGSLVIEKMPYHVDDLCQQT